MMVKDSTQNLSLVDLLAFKAECRYVADLHLLRPVQKTRLADYLETVKPSDFPLSQWNDALEYIVHVPTQETAEQARALLMETLRES